MLQNFSRLHILFTQRLSDSTTDFKSDQKWASQNTYRKLRTPSRSSICGRCEKLTWTELFFSTACCIHSRRLAFYLHFSSGGEAKQLVLTTFRRCETFVRMENHMCETCKLVSWVRKLKNNIEKMIKLRLWKKLTEKSCIYCNVSDGAKDL